MSSPLGEGPSSALDPTYGAYLIGSFFAIFLHGLLTVQTWNYFENFPEDSIKHKKLVVVVWLLDTLHLVVVCQSVYHYLVTNWGFKPALEVATWELVIHIFLIGLACFVCQIFFLQRIWVFSGRSYIVVGIVFLLCLASFILSIHLPAHLIIVKLPVNQFPGQKPEVTALFLSGAASDFLIAGLLCYYLGLDHKGFEATRSVVGRVLRYAVATGLVTSALRVGAVIALFVAPGKLYYIAMHLSLGRLYTNALLATLNARKKMREALKRNITIDTFKAPVSENGATSFDIRSNRVQEVKSTGSTSMTYSYTVERAIHHDDDIELEHIPNAKRASMTSSSSVNDNGHLSA